MGKKGDEQSKGPIAKQLYVEGHTLDAIADILDTSTTSLGRWKEKSRVPGAEFDGWELARQNKRGLLDRLKKLLEREVEHAERCKPGEINPSSVDAMSKFGAIVHKMEAEERKETERLLKMQQENSVIAEYDKGAVFIDNLKYTMQKIKEYAPASIELIAEHLPMITEDFKETLK